MRYDAVIVGAGPIGLAVAIDLASRGARTVAIDRRRPPVDKACGEGVMPDGVAAFRALGVEWPPSGAAPFRGIRYVGDDLSVEAAFPGDPGWVVRRPELHRALIARAETVGVELRWETVVRGLAKDGVTTPRGVVAGRWIVGADGLRSRVRRWSGLEAAGRGPARFGVRRHYRVEPWTDHVEVHWADGCEAYVSPLADGVGVAFLWSGRKASFDALLERVPALARRLRAAEVVSRDRGVGPLDQRSRRLVRDRVALVGDAAGYRDAITGEGIALGLHQAAVLAEAIDRGTLASYERAVRRLTRLPFALIGALLWVERRPRLRRRLLASLAKDSGLFARLLAIHVREAPVRAIGVGGLVTLAATVAGGPWRDPGR